MLRMLKTPVPVLVSVMVSGALEDKRFCDGKVRLVGEIDAVGLPRVPVPLRATDCGLPGALSATERDAARAPATVGVKTTLIVQ
jgi:hypothetical protein